MLKNKSTKITFLGTGTSTGVPMVASNHFIRFSKDERDFRLRSSIMVTTEKCNFIVDCGPDFRQQMLREQVEHIHGIFFTHEHADHIAGLDDIRGFYFRQGKIPIYCCKRVLKTLKKRFDYIFATENRYPSAPEVAVQVISEQNILEFEDLIVTPIQVLHGKLPILGYRFNDIAYLTDIKSISEKEKLKLKDIDTLIVTGLRFEAHHTHFNIEEALHFIKEIQPKKSYLTHISAPLGYHAEVEKELPDNVFLAYDGLVVV